MPGTFAHSSLELLVDLAILIARTDSQPTRRFCDNMCCLAERQIPLHAEPLRPGLGRCRTLGLRQCSDPGREEL